jgi:hypothetical protein
MDTTEAAVIDTLVFGRLNEWEKHELGTGARYVKPLPVVDSLTKAQVAERYDALGFVPHFFREQGRDYVALEGIKQAGRYKTVEQAFVEQIAKRI